MCPICPFIKMQSKANFQYTRIIHIPFLLVCLCLQRFTHLNETWPREGAKRSPSRLCQLFQEHNDGSGVSQTGNTPFNQSQRERKKNTEPP